MTIDNLQLNNVELNRNKAQEKEKEAEKQLNIFLSQIFECNEPEKRFEAFSNRLSGFLIIADGIGLNSEESEKVKNDLKSCCVLEDKEEFIRQGLIALRPLVEWKKNNEATFEAKERENFVSSSGFIRLNESLSYGKDRNLVHIHVAPSETMSDWEKYMNLKDGLRKLQEVLKKDEEIKQVTASSWIIATRGGGRIMEKLGFTVTGEISPEFKEKFFKGETRPICEAHIDREDFLKPDKYK